MNDKNDKPIVAVAALVFNESNQILFLKSPKWNSKWALPAGKVEAGETLENAIHREVLEETGLNITPPSMLCVQEIIKPIDFHSPAHFVSHAYLAYCRNEPIRLNHESVDFVWATYEQALELDLNSPTADLLARPAVIQSLKEAKTAPVLQKNLGWVIVDQLEFDCIIGILPRERTDPQPLRLSISLQTSFWNARNSEDVADTIDYFQLSHQAREFIVDRKFKLLETLVEELATLIFEDHRISSIKIRAEKPNAIPGARCSAVEIERDNDKPQG